MKLFASLCLFTAMLSGQSFYDAAISANALAYTAKPQIDNRTFEIPGHFYVLSFEYNPNFSMVPAISGAATHYSATIALFEIVNGAKQKIGESFAGEWTGGQCYEDITEDVVERQLKATGKLTEPIRTAIAKIREAKAYAKMEPTEVREGVLQVTKKGLDTYFEIQVGNQVVWRNPNPPKISRFAGTSGIELNTGSGIGGSDKLIRSDIIQVSGIAVECPVEGSCIITDTPPKQIK